MGQKILVVDDSKTICRVVEWVYYASPYGVQTAHTAADALQAARRDRPDAVLVDYQLPDSTGFDLVRQLRADPGLKDVPIVMLGGTYHPFDPLDADRAGADGWVMKPFTADGLMDAVSQAIAGGGRRSEPAPEPEVIAETAPLPMPTEESEPEPQRPRRPSPPSPHTPVASQPAIRPAPEAPPARPPSRPAPPPVPAGGFRRAPSVEETGRRRPMVPPPPAPLRASSAPERPQAVTMETESLVEEEASLRSVPPAPVSVRPQAPTPPPIPIPTSSDDASAAPTPSEPPATTVAPAAPAMPSTEEVEAHLRAILPSILAAEGLMQTPGSDDLKDALREVLPGVLREILPHLVKEYLASMLKTTGVRMEQYSKQKIDAFCDTELPRLASEAIRPE